MTERSQLGWERDCPQHKQRGEGNKEHLITSINGWTRAFPRLKHPGSLSWDYIFLWELGYPLSLIPQETENKGTEGRQRKRIQGTRCPQPGGHLLLPTAPSFSVLPQSCHWVPRVSPVPSWVPWQLNREVIIGLLPRLGMASIYSATLQIAYESLHMRKQKMTEVQSSYRVLLSGQVGL